MVVKDILNSQVQNGAKGQSPKLNLNLRSSSEALASVQLQTQKSSEAAVKVDAPTKSNFKSELRAKLNEVINVGNVASEATTEIDKLIKSIGGIVEQAKSDGTSEQRRLVLEKEANELVGEIKKAAQTTAANGVKPLAGDKIRLEVEEKLGKTLDLLLPDDAKEAFGIGTIKFSTKEAIISTIVSVETAHQNILKLQEAVDKTAKSIQNAASQIDVAIQNTEAAEVSIRDLDDALKVASDTRSVISKDPEKALKSVGDLSGSALGLLNQ